MALLVLAVVEARRSVDVAAALGDPSSSGQGHALLDGLRGALAEVTAEALSAKGQAHAQRPARTPEHCPARPPLQAAAQLPLGGPGARRLLEGGWANPNARQLLLTMGQRLAAVMALAAGAHGLRPQCSCLEGPGAVFDEPCSSDDPSVGAALRAVRDLYRGAAPALAACRGGHALGAAGGAAGGSGGAQAGVPRGAQGQRRLLPPAAGAGWRRRQVAGAAAPRMCGVPQDKGRRRCGAAALQGLRYSDGRLVLQPGVLRAGLGGGAQAGLPRCAGLAAATLGRPIDCPALEIALDVAGQRRTNRPVLTILLQMFCQQLCS